MARGEMLPIQHAARAFGVPDDRVRRLAEEGAIPEAVNRDGEWLIPTLALAGIARNQGWTLDLAALQHQLDGRSPGRFADDALAAQAAVLLARTQATAARVESRDLLRRLRQAATTAAADRAARLEAAEALARSEQELELSRRRHAVAESMVAELRDRLATDDRQFTFMVDRITSLEQERRRLSRSLGWLGRLRYRRLLDRELSRPPRSPEDRSVEHGEAIPPPARVATTAATDPFVDHEPPRSIDEPATEDLPVWDLAWDDRPVPVGSADEIVDHDRRAGVGPDDRGSTSVPRTADGRFDQSALATARSGTPLPTS